MRTLFSLLTFCFVGSFSSAQNVDLIPVHTAYFLPAQEPKMDTVQSQMIFRWKDPKTAMDFFAFHQLAGKLQLRLRVMGSKIPVVLKLSVNAAKPIPVSIAPGKTMRDIALTTVSLKDTGFIQIHFSADRLPKEGIGIVGLVVDGPVAKTMHFNRKNRRNAASVHLRYPLEDSIRSIGFYNELTVPAGGDPVHSFYMANGFSRGYFGMQVNSQQERRIVFSVWDAGNEGVDRNKVPDSNKVTILATGDGVVSNDFGQEGTGGHSHWVYPWKADSTYRFLLTALADSATQTTIYTGYFYVPESQRWKLIAAFRAPKDGNRLKNLYSFSENFDGVNGQLQRKVNLGNQWVQQQNGRWVELTKAVFTTDQTGKDGDRIDIGAGSDSTRFYLWHGGFQKASAMLNTMLVRMPVGKAPAIDITKDADSLAQAQKDISLIAASVASKKIDTTGSIEHVYYQLLKNGTGPFVAVSDTVTVHYKGSLLADGSIFDQTTSKPATFPLQRLIRGWQLALPKCRVGGAIRVIIPSAMAYSIRTRSKAIPPNSVLVFDIEVIDTKKAEPK